MNFASFLNGPVCRIVELVMPLREWLDTAPKFAGRCNCSVCVIVAGARPLPVCGGLQLFIDLNELLTPSPDLS